LCRFELVTCLSSNVLLSPVYQFTEEGEAVTNFSTLTVYCHFLSLFYITCLSSMFIVTLFIITCLSSFVYCYFVYHHLFIIICLLVLCLSSLVYHHLFIVTLCIIICLSSFVYCYFVYHHLFVILQRVGKSLRQMRWIPTLADLYATSLHHSS